MLNILTLNTDEFVKFFFQNTVLVLKHFYSQKSVHLNWGEDILPNKAVTQ